MTKVKYPITEGLKKRVAELEEALERASSNSNKTLIDAINRLINREIQYLRYGKAVHEMERHISYLQKGSQVNKDYSLYNMVGHADMYYIGRSNIKPIGDSPRDKELVDMASNRVVYDFVRKFDFFRGEGTVYESSIEALRNILDTPKKSILSSKYRESDVNNHGSLVRFNVTNSTANCGALFMWNLNSSSPYEEVVLEAITVILTNHSKSMMFFSDSDRGIITQTMGALSKKGVKEKLLDLYNANSERHVALDVSFQRIEGEVNPNSGNVIYTGALVFKIDTDHEEEDEYYDDDE